MYVCLCKGVTCSQIRQQARQGQARSLRDLSRTLGVATQCGKCGRCARAVLEQAAAEVPAGPAPLPCCA